MKTISQIKTLILLALFAIPIHSQKFSFGACPMVTTKADIAYATEFTKDIWKEFAKTPSIYSHNWTCISYKITTVTANLFFTVQIRGFHKLSGKTLSTTGTLTVAGPIGDKTTTTNYFTMTFPGKNYKDGANYYIIDAVAEKYQVWYACENVHFGKVENAIIFVSSTATLMQITAALEVLEKKGYPLFYLKKTGTSCSR